MKVKDIDEAMSWALKAPFKEGGVTEVRRIAEMKDFEDVMSEELREKEEEMRKQVEKNAESS